MKQAQKVDAALHPMLKMYSGFSPEAPDTEVRQYWEEEFPAEIEKPCGILLWCPYGPLVEDFPLHDEQTDRTPIAPPSECMVFGHQCPAYFVSEPFADPGAVTSNCLCDECRAALEAGNDLNESSER